MHDARVDSLARQLVRYSVALKKGENILIDLHDVPECIGLALIREVRARGGNPILRVHQGSLSREMLLGASDEQYKVIAKNLLAEMRDMQAYIAVRGSHNIAESSDVPAANMKLAMKHLRGVIDWRVKKTKWCVLRWPSPSMAQQAGMSTEAFEDFYFKVCNLDYSKMSRAMDSLVRVMEKADNVYTIPGNFGWSDIGSWDEVYRMSGKDELGNSITGLVIPKDTRNSYIFTQGKLVATIGVEDLIIVNTDDALLICKRGRSQDVKDIADYLRRKKMDDYL